MLVLLEEVAGVHLVAVLHQALQGETQTGSEGGGHEEETARLQYLLSDQQGGALQGHRHHLVRVPGDRVGPEGITKHARLI